MLYFILVMLLQTRWIKHRFYAVMKDLSELLWRKRVSALTADPSGAMLGFGIPDKPHKSNPGPCFILHLPEPPLLPDQTCVVMVTRLNDSSEATAQLRQLQTERLLKWTTSYSTIIRLHFLFIPDGNLSVPFMTLATCSFLRFGSQCFDLVVKVFLIFSGKRKTGNPLTCCGHSVTKYG
uniref:Uncharacterized protein n=1 Tax=Nothobranchius furzeri TaxID=105023 RepID=A0A1A8U5H8_NOTFU